MFQVALTHSLPLPRRETLQQSSSLSTVSPATVDLTLKVNRYHYTLKDNNSKCNGDMTQIFLSCVSLRWNQLGKHGRTLQVLKRILQSLLLLPQSPPVHPHIQASPQPRCHRFQWLLLPQALHCQVAVFQVTTSHIPSKPLLDPDWW